MNKKRVLHLLSSNKYSGAENVACTIIKNSDEISYYCSPKGPVENVLKEKNINYIPIKKLNISEVKKVAKIYNIDLVHAHDFKASFIASFLPKKITIISQLHCNYKFIKYWNIYTLLYTIVQKRFNKIIVVSKDILNDAIFRNKIKNKTVIIENVIDAKEIKKRSIEFETKKYDLIFVARLTEVKRPLFFIELIKELKKTNPNISSCILGQGNLYEECKEKIKEYKLETNIDLLGFVNNPYPYVKNSKIEILPSTAEGLPMSTIEALVLETPVINSGVDGLKDIFNGHEEYIAKNKEEYINSINNILNNKNKNYKDDCKNISKNYTQIDKYINKIKKIHNSI